MLLGLASLPCGNSHPGPPYQWFARGMIFNLWNTWPLPSGTKQRNIKHAGFIGIHFIILTNTYLFDNLQCFYLLWSQFSIMPLLAGVKPNPFCSLCSYLTLNLNWAIQVLSTVLFSERGCAMCENMTEGLREFQKPFKKLSEFGCKGLYMSLLLAHWKQSWVALLVLRFYLLPGVVVWRLIYLAALC